MTEVRRAYCPDHIGGKVTKAKAKPAPAPEPVVEEEEKVEEDVSSALVPVEEPKEPSLRGENDDFGQLVSFFEPDLSLPEGYEPLLPDIKSLNKDQLHNIYKDGYEVDVVAMVREKIY